MPASETPSQIASARTRMTAAITAATGLDEDVLHNLVHAFYGEVRRDPMLGPIFEERIADWGPHLDRMVAFWSSVALMTGRYHGSPMLAHTPLPIGPEHFERWLELFRATARATCTPAGAQHVIERAERIARSLLMAVDDAKAGSVARLRP